VVEKFSQRAKLILSAMIAHYIATAEPVGSRTISKLKSVKLSPASIRNVMADLEEMGYLNQPHVSAGRVPTPKGMRFYVNSIVTLGELDETAQAQMRRALAAQPRHEIKGVLKATGRALSGMSRQTAVVAVAVPETDIFEHMEFVLLRPGLILVVFISREGGVQNRVVETGNDLSQDDLDNFTRYLNELLTDLTLTQVKERLAREMAREKVRFDQVISRALRLGQMALPGPRGGNVYVEGQLNLMQAPEFADVARLRQIFQAFEEKSTLLRLLEKTMAAPGVQVFIDQESEVDGLEGLTAVTASYGGQEKPAGALGVIGPMRMDYSHVIPIVDFTARLVSCILETGDQSATG
jgi:heat-inducible transcriptional repressor